MRLLKYCPKISWDISNTSIKHSSKLRMSGISPYSRDIPWILKTWDIPKIVCTMWDVMNIYVETIISNIMRCTVEDKSYNKAKIGTTKQTFRKISFSVDQ